MNRSFRGCLSELENGGVLPEAFTCVYAAGSLVRGWGNARSDFDVYVIVDQPWRSPSAQIDSVALHPDSIPVETFYVDGRRWDIEYWLDEQVDQLFAKVSPAQLDSIQPAANRMMDPEIAFLQRFSHAAPIAQDDWLEERKRQLAKLPVDSMMALRALHRLDIFTEDAVGQLAADDVESAVLSAKIALRCAVDALLASHGEFGESPKWFARRYRAADPPELSFDAWWALETMQSFDADAPARWVEEVLGVCQRIAGAIDVMAEFSA